ncbi:MAG: DUF6351 family protein [Bacteroidota bacterium]|nr:DUF6351 family protein [Bacteroidota bacterium]
MKHYSWLTLLFLLFTGACKDELDVAPVEVSTETEQTADLQTVQTYDGSTTKYGCKVKRLRTGEIIQICKPTNWNGELIIYAHGYVSAFAPLALPTEAAPYVPLFTSMGYAFATTSYTENGLAIQTGIQNILDLRQRFIKEYGKPKYIYLTGGSEGGIITTLTIERYPTLFNGGLSLCGPCGDFRKQINYYADFRVLFDYFFPGVLPGDAINIPNKLIRNWESVYVPAILQAIKKDPATALKLLKVAQAPYDPNDLNTVGETFIRVLWYDVFATRDAIQKLRGQPYDNCKRVYTGTGDRREDKRLNANVDRFTADKQALRNIERYYQTTGNIRLPLVKAHTTADPVIPFWHLLLYQVKVAAQGRSSLFNGIPVERYGHCTFNETEIVAGLSLLVQKVKGQAPSQAQHLITQARKGKIVQSVTLVQ